MRLIDEVRADGMDVPIAMLNRTAPECDCARCREQAKRDEQVRKELCHDAPLTRRFAAPSPDGRGTAEARRMRGAVKAVISLRRACVPLDSPERIEQWSA